LNSGLGRIRLRREAKEVKEKPAKRRRKTKNKLTK